MNAREKFDNAAPTQGPLKITGPTRIGIFGDPSSQRAVGYGIRQEEPAKFGGGDQIIEHGLTKADAHRFAASPELLEVLKKWQTFTRDNYKPGEISWDVEMDAAIAKAEGIVVTVEVCAGCNATHIADGSRDRATEDGEAFLHYCLSCWNEFFVMPTVKFDGGPRS